MSARSRVALVAVLAAFLLAKAPCLTKPFHWDAMGYVMSISWYFHETGPYPISHMETFEDGLLHRLKVDSGHPPLFFQTVALGWWIFGVTPLVPRLLVLAGALAAMAVSARMAERIVGRGWGPAAAGCLGTVPLFFSQSGIAHLDVPLAGLTVLAVWAAFEGRLAVYLLAATAMLLSKAQGAFGMPAVTVLVLLRLWRDRPGWAEALRRLVIWHVPVAIFAGWKLWHWAETGIVLTAHPDNVSPYASWSMVALGLARNVFYVFFHRGQFFYVALGLVGAWWAWRRGVRIEFERIEYLVVLLLPMLTIFGVQALVKNYGARYYIPGLPGLVVAGLWGLRALGLKRSRNGLILGTILGFQLLCFRGPDPLLVGLDRVGVIDMGRLQARLNIRENNMDYLHLVSLHQDAMRWIEQEHPGARLLVDFPLVLAARYPHQGYVSRPFPVLHLPDVVDTVGPDDFDLLVAPTETMFPEKNQAVIERLDLIRVQTFGGKFGRVDLWAPRRASR